MGFVDQPARNIGIKARQADVQARLQVIGVSGHAEINFRVDGGLGRQPDLALGCSQAQGPEPAAGADSGVAA